MPSYELFVIFLNLASLKYILHLGLEIAKLGSICNKGAAHYVTFNVYKRISWVVSNADNITIATNSICHRRTKGTYPDYNCSDDNASFIALFTHVRNQKITVCYFLYSLTIANTTLSIFLNLITTDIDWDIFAFILRYFFFCPMTHEQRLVMLHQ